jgi:hypothetical protein
LALAIAGAWLSNPPVGVMACYLLAAVALAHALLARSWAPALRATAGAGLGIGLVGIYLVPADWEQRWVDIHQVTEDPGQTLENNWLFAVHADPALALHDAVLHTASMIAVLMIAAALAGLLVCWRRGRLPGRRSWWIPLALIPPAVLFCFASAMEWAPGAEVPAVSMAMAAGRGGADGGLPCRRCLAPRICPVLAAHCCWPRMLRGFSGDDLFCGEESLPGLRRRGLRAGDVERVWGRPGIHRNLRVRTHRR